MMHISPLPPSFPPSLFLSLPACFHYQVFLIPLKINDDKYKAMFCALSRILFYILSSLKKT